MRRVDTGHVAAAVHNAVRKARETPGHPLYKADWRITQVTADMALNLVLGGQHVLVAPDRVRINGGHPLALVNDRPGIWGEDEPLPAFSNLPPPPTRS